MTCRNGEQLKNFLDSLTHEQLGYSLACTYSDDVPSGEADVEVDDVNEVLTFVGSSDDV